MILSFKKTYPWGGLTGFENKIIAGRKIHTIRKDPKSRWKAGNIVHCANGVRTPDYNCFFTGRCQLVQDIEIIYDRDFFGYDPVIEVDGKILAEDVAIDLAFNDGFDTWQEFTYWFNQDFKGKLIHWTDYEY